MSTPANTSWASRGLQRSRPAWSAPCCPTSSNGASMPSDRGCGSSMAARRCAAQSRRPSAPQRPRSSPQGPARQRPSRAARCLLGQRCQPGSASTAAPDQLLGLQAPWGRRQPARGSGEQPDLADPGHHRIVVPHPAHHQPDRNPQRAGRQLHAQRQALERRGHGAAMGRQRLERRRSAHACAAATR